MKALSIKDPWAYLIAIGEKDVENRTWRTNFRGRIYIHVSAKPAKVFLSLFSQLNILSLPGNRSLSAIIGEVTIIDCIRNSLSLWAEDGCYHWILKDAILYDTPILNIKGKLGLWDYDGK